MSKVFVSYSHIDPDQQLAAVIVQRLRREGHIVFWDQWVRLGQQWSDEIDRYIIEADFIVVLVSKKSAHSLMMTEEVSRARQRFERTGTRPRILPVRVAFRDQLPYRLGAHLNDLQYKFWNSPDDDERISTLILSEIAAGPLGHVGIDVRDQRPPPLPDGAGRSSTVSQDWSATSAEVRHGAPPLPESSDNDWRTIHANSFMMGSLNGETDRYPDEHRHQIYITSPFLMKRTPVTLGEYERFRKIDRPLFVYNADHPVVNVRWHDAVSYCNWRSNQDNLTPCYRGAGDDVICDFSANGYRLPTEAEWEYACRAGSHTPFNTGSELTSSQANYDGNHPYGRAAVEEYRAGTVPAGSLPENLWGLCEMHGNVCEWCWDWYDQDFYLKSPKSDPVGPPRGIHRVHRGGSWFSWAVNCRSARRDRGKPDIRSDECGFRIVRRIVRD